MSCQPPGMGQEYPTCWHAIKQNFPLEVKLLLQPKLWILLIWMRLSKWQRWKTYSFLSKVIHGQTKTMLLGNNMHVMMQTLKGGDGSCLPHGLSVMNTYTEVTTGSKWAAVIVKSLMAIPITIAKGIKVTWVVATNAVLQMEVAPGTLEKLHKMQGIQRTRMSVEWRREVLFQQLDLSGLEGWSDKKSSGCPCPVSWIPWQLLLRAWKVGLYRSSETWDQSCCQWALQEEVPKNSPTHSGWGLGTCEGDAGSRCYLPQSEPMV